MPHEVIDRIHHIAEVQNFPPGLAFTQLDGIPYQDKSDDDSVQSNETTKNENNVDAEIEGVHIDQMPEEQNEEENFEDAVEYHPPADVNNDEFHEEINVPQMELISKKKRKLKE